MRWTQQTIFVCFEVFQGLMNQPGKAGLVARKFIVKFVCQVELDSYNSLLMKVCVTWLFGCWKQFDYANMEQDFHTQLQIWNKIAISKE